METEPRPHILQTSATPAGAMTPARGRMLFNGQTEAGRTNSVIVYTDGTPQGNATAQAILQTADADYAATQAAFGGIALPQGQEGDDQTVPRTALPVQVLMDEQAGGAYHFGCNATDIYVEPDPQLANGFFVAELVEVFEAAINNGWDCGQTNGEGLSRVLAGERNPNLGSLFVQTGQSWWANGHVDYVNDNSADDTNQDANGCATLFLYYLHSQLGFGWPQIVAAGGGSLGATYQQLTGQDPVAGFNAFVSLVSSLDTGAGLNLPASGNPFPLTGAAAQAPAGQPATQGSEQEMPVGVFGSYSPSYGSAADYSAAVAAAVGASMLDGSALVDDGVLQDAGSSSEPLPDTVAQDSSPYAPAADSVADTAPSPVSSGVETVPPMGWQQEPDAASSIPPSESGWVAEVVEEERFVAPMDATNETASAAEPRMQVVEEVEVIPYAVPEPAAESAPPRDSAATHPAGAPPANAWARADDLSRTGPIEPARRLDAALDVAPQAAASDRRQGEVIETMIAVLVVLIVLVALGLITVLFANNLIHL